MGEDDRIPSESSPNSYVRLSRARFPEDRENVRESKLLRDAINRKLSNFIIYTKMERNEMIRAEI